MVDANGLGILLLPLCFLILSETFGICFDISDANVRVFDGEKVQSRAQMLMISQKDPHVVRPINLQLISASTYMKIETRP